MNILKNNIYDTIFLMTFNVGISMVLVLVNKIEVVPARDFEVYRGNTSTAPFIINVDTSWNWVFN
jgi:hypothetical protein